MLIVNAKEFLDKNSFYIYARTYHLFTYCLFLQSLDKKANTEILK